MERFFEFKLSLSDFKNLRKFMFNAKIIFITKI